jgi:nicotinamidase-related amidase
MGGDMKMAKAIQISLLASTSVLAAVLVVSCGKAAKSGANTTPALLVIDIQNEYLPTMSAQDKKTAYGLINRSIALFHEKGAPVIRVYNTVPGFGPKPGTRDFAYPKWVVAGPNDTQIIKTTSDAFFETKLQKVLKSKGCDTLFLCGLSATACVSSTYYGAQDLKYSAFMIRNALLSDDHTLTQTTYTECDTVTFDTMKSMLEKARK